MVPAALVIVKAGVMFIVPVFVSVPALNARTVAVVMFSVPPLRSSRARVLPPAPLRVMVAAGPMIVRPAPVMVPAVQVSELVNVTSPPPVSVPLSVTMLVLVTAKAKMWRFCRLRDPDPV